MNVPIDTREALDQLAAAERRRSARQSLEDHEDRRRRVAEERDAHAAQPVAARVIAWALELARSGVLDELPSGADIYAAFHLRVAVACDGSLTVRYFSKGYGATHRGITQPEELVRRAHPEHVTALARNIESGAVWRHIRDLASRSASSIHEIENRVHEDD